MGKGIHLMQRWAHLNAHKHPSWRISVTPGANRSDVSVSPSDGNTPSEPTMGRSSNDECMACTVDINTQHCAGSLCSGTRTKNRRPWEIQKWPYWPTPCLVLVIFPGTRTHPVLTQIQHTYTFICFMAANQREPEEKVNTQQLKGTVCLLPFAGHVGVKTLFPDPWSWPHCPVLPNQQKSFQINEKLVPVLHGKKNKIKNRKTLSWLFKDWYKTKQLNLLVLRAACWYLI